MKKSILCVFLVCALLFAGCSPRTDNNTPHKAAAVKVSAREQAAGQWQMRGVWMSYYELSTQDGQRGGDAFRHKVINMFDKAAKAGLNTVITQVRPFSDALYPSAIFPWSKILTGAQGADPGYDPLRIMLDLAHERGLKLHAWINPYRIAFESNINLLAKNNPARIWLEDGDPSNDGYVIKEGDGLYYNPAYPEVQRLIIDGVREILRNYDIDGIQFDDYFYPTASDDIDANKYKEYINSGGLLPLPEWRRENVNVMISTVYAAVKAIDKDVMFGISPMADIDKDEDQYFADVKKWCSQSGYADYICPQLYFGFEHSKYPFISTADGWAKLKTAPGVALYAGLALYKSGKEDAYAGGGKSEGSPRFEWVRDPDVIQKQIDALKDMPQYGGYILFSIGSIDDFLNMQSRQG